MNKISRTMKWPKTELCINATKREILYLNFFYITYIKPAVRKFPLLFVHICKISLICVKFPLEIFWPIFEVFSNKYIKSENIWGNVPKILNLFVKLHSFVCNFLLWVNFLLCLLWARYKVQFEVLASRFRSFFFTDFLSLLKKHV